MDEFDTDDETRRLLGALDPAHSLPPADADALATLMEDTMSQPTSNESAPARGRTGLTRGVLAVGIAAAAVLAVTTLVNGGDDKPSRVSNGGNPHVPTVTRLTTGSAPAAKCMMPSAEIVAKQPVAIEGTVSSIKDGLVTLKPSHFYAGTATDLVTVTAPDLSMSELPVDFQVGQDYIVGATGGRVSVCGLSGLATDDLRALYEQAYGD